MGLRDLFRRKRFQVDPNAGPFDTAIAGLEATDTYVDEHGRRRKLSPEEKAAMRADLEKLRDQARHPQPPPPDRSG